MSVWSAIIDELREAARAAVPGADDVVFAPPPDSAMGDIAVPCFALAKALGQSPAAIAERLADVLGAHPLVTSAKAAGPYCNVTLDAAEVARRVLAEHPSPRGRGERGNQKEEIVFEFISPNANKPLHLGHLRNAFYGEAVARLLEAAGHRVHRVMLLNDRGIAMAKAMLAYMRWGQGTTPETEGVKGDHFVGNWYVVFDQKLQHDAKLLDEAQELVRKWEAGDAEIITLWQRMCDWVIAGHQETLAKLGIAFERTYRESDIYEQGRAIVERGRASGVFVRDIKGNTVASLEVDGLDDKVVERADGTTVYATQDLALVAEKERGYRGARQIVVTAVEQDYYFRQLNAMLRKLGMSPVEHLSYEMVNLPEGKMKSREGTVVDADDLVAKLEQLAIEEIARREDPVPGEPEVGTDEPSIIASDAERERAAYIALAALRFMLLHVSPRATVTFDPRAAIAFTGKTGPYLQYAHARLCSILRKAEQQGTWNKEQGASDASLLTHDAEKALLVRIAQWEDVVASAAEQRDPSALAQFLYDFARAFGDFYRDVPVIITADDALRAARLALVARCQTMLGAGLTILGIEPIERM